MGYGVGGKKFERKNQIDLTAVIAYHTYRT